jgi:hypothetical protein
MPAPGEARRKDPYRRNSGKAPLIQPEWNATRPRASSSARAEGIARCRAPCASRTQPPTCSGGSRRTISPASSSPGSGPLEIEPVDLSLHVAGSRCLFQDEQGGEARILSGRGPGEVAERLEVLVTMDGIDPVTGLPPPRERQDLVRGVVEGVEGQTEGLVLDEREEAIGAVLDPLENHAPRRVFDPCLDERRPFVARRDPKPCGRQRVPVMPPGDGEGLRGVVKEIDVARQPGPSEKLVQRDAASDVALASLPSDVG